MDVAVVLVADVAIGFGVVAGVVVELSGVIFVATFAFESVKHPNGILAPL